VKGFCGMAEIHQIPNMLNNHIKRWMINRRVRQIASKVNSRTHPDAEVRPVIFFNASTRLVGISLNAAFSQLTSWAMRLQKVSVIHFVCKAGMSHCVLGTDRQDFSKPPPCRGCIAQSGALYSAAFAIPFTYQPDEHLSASLEGLTVANLMDFEYQPQGWIDPISAKTTSPTLPLGQLVLPSIRWVLRRHHLQDDEPTRYLYRQYILSAGCVAQEFSTLLHRANPQAVVLFNGQFFPEATAKWVATQQGIRTITHEVGLQPFSAFFTTGEATAYPLDVPNDFELSDSQNQRLDAYLSQRFHGQFSMAGVQFWPEIKGLEQDFLRKAKEYKQIVPVFTNVIFDTSQPHSNVLFPHMFAWLDTVLEIIRRHPETLFVIRAHPDEARPGKTSQESVSQWIAQSDADSIPNLVFIDSHQPLSSYELIQRSKFVMVYNSTIGLEASIMGAPVLCAGRARYTQLPTVFFPTSAQEFQKLAETYLTSEIIDIPSEYRHNARRFLYYQLYRSSLPFTDFLEEDTIWKGFVRLRKFSWNQLTPVQSPAIQTILNGILEGGNFLLAADI
jgi:hypothetical protein